MDPIRQMLADNADAKRARTDPEYIAAELARTAPTAAAFGLGMDLGYRGAAALDAGHQLDRAADNIPAAPAPAVAPVVRPVEALTPGNNQAQPTPEQWLRGLV